MGDTVWRTLVVLAAGGLLLAACGGDGDGPAGDDAATGGGVRAGPHGGSQPAGADIEAVRPHVEGLLARYDELANRIVADPGVARDTEGPLVAELVGLFEPGGRAVVDLLDSWVARADAGESMQPFDDRHPATATRLDGAVEAVSDDEVAFPTCDEQRFVIVDAEGRVTARVRLLEQPGQGTAVRVAGEWRLRRLDVTAGAGCRTEEGP